MEFLNNNMVNLVQSIKKYYNLELQHETNSDLDSVFNNEKPRHVVLMCLDGLGACLLNKAPFLNSKLFQKINTVFPPTTACATITLQTGLYPCEHGWIGWSQYFKEFDAIIELFTGIDFYGGEKYEYSNVIKDINFTPFFNNIKNSKSFLPNFDINGFNTFNEMIDATKQHIKSNETSFSYVYWNQPDSILHETGCNSIESRTMIEDIDNVLNDFSTTLNDTMIIITADHGHINCDPIYLSDYPKLFECISKLPSIEQRCANLFVYENKNQTFLKEIKPLLKYFDLYTKEEFVKADFFCFGKIHFKINEFLGDYILVGKDKYYLSIDRLSDKNKVFKSSHAGLTKDEMEIPLIIIT